MKALRLLWFHRQMLWATTLNDIKSRYRGSVLGLVWLVLYPAVFLGTYASVFILVLKVRVGFMTTPEYISLIFCGLIPFLGFAESLGAGVSAVVSHAGLVKNTLFPIDLVPAKVMLASHVTELVGILALGGLLLVEGNAGWCLGLVPLVFVLQLLLTLGIIWLLSALNVFFRDLSLLVSVLILLLMLASPIGYTEEMIPEGLRAIARLNPLYYLIGTYRELMLFDRLPPLLLWGPLVGLSIGSFVFGYWIFSRLKPIFPDYV
jgi:homopolymeric O-antigen transport system permease protein